MPTHPEAVRLNLEYYRKQAKSLLQAARQNDPAALQRLKQAPVSGHNQLALNHAQLAIARENGFASWPRFRSFIIQSKLDFEGAVGVFVRAAVSDMRRAQEMLDAQPGIANGGVYPALVLGDVTALASASLKVGDKGGPLGWEPLLYVCFSRHASRDSERAAALLETAKVLLGAGADPNGSYTPAELPGNPLSCLYAAAGLNNNPELARVLLDAGASTDDGESLYHSTEHADLECMRLLLERGASANGTNALKHMLDREDPDGVRLLLAAGADPNERDEQGETALHQAVSRGRSIAVVTALLQAGVELDAQRRDGRTAYAIAMQTGRSELAQLLAERGASIELSPLDRFIVGSDSVDAENVARLRAEMPELTTMPDAQRLVPDLASMHRTSAVRALLDAGLPVDTRGELGATALHWACWKGFADLVELLLSHGASLTIEDERFHGTPPGWFGHGVQNCDEEGGEYAEVARLLIAAGAEIPSVDMPTGNPEVDAVLREHRLIE